MLTRVLVLASLTAPSSGLRSKLPRSVSTLSRRVAVSLVPVSAFPSVARAARTVGYQDGSALTPAAATAMANSAGIREPTLSLNGKYEDPLHPGMMRKIAQSGKFLTISGVDEDGTAWVVKGLQSGRALLFDFSSRGGDGNVRATADVLGIEP